MLKAILIIGLLLRLVNLDQSFWLDEASQAQLSVLPISEIWFGRSGDFQPPLFYLLSHYWLQISHTEVWARLLPVSFGVVNIYVLYLLTKQLLGSKKIIIGPLTLNLEHLAAFLLAINPFHVYYSHEFRMYSLLCLLATLSMYLLLKKSHWLFLINALLFYTHYSSVFLFITQIIYVVFFNRQLTKYIATSYVLFAICSLPWLPQFILQLRSGVNIDTYLPGWRDVLTLGPLRSTPLVLFKLLAGRITIFPKSVYAIYLAFVLLVGVLGFILAYSRRKLLYLWAFLPIIMSIVLSFKLPQTQPFRLIFILPALLILLSQATSRFPKTFLTLLVYISIVGNFMYFTRPRLQREQWRPALEFLREQSAPVVFKFSATLAPVAWYAPHLVSIPSIPSFPSQPSDVARALAPHQFQPRLLLVNYLGDLTDPAKHVDQTLLDLGFTRVNQYNYEGVGIIDDYARSN